MSVVVLAGASLLAPLPEDAGAPRGGDGRMDARIQEPQTGGLEAPAADAAPEAPEPAPGRAPGRGPGEGPGEGPGAEVASEMTPPPGSEFARAGEDTEPATPGAEAGPSAPVAPLRPDPGKVAATEAPDTAPPAVPEIATEGVAAPVAPEAGGESLPRISGTDGGKAAAVPAVPLPGAAGREALPEAAPESAPAPPRGTPEAVRTEENPGRAETAVVEGRAPAAETMTETMTETVAGAAPGAESAPRPEAGTVAGSAPETAPEAAPETLPNTAPAPEMAAAEPRTETSAPRPQPEAERPVAETPAVPMTPRADAPAPRQPGRASPTVRIESVPPEEPEGAAPPESLPITERSPREGLPGKVAVRETGGTDGIGKRVVPLTERQKPGSRLPGIGAAPETDGAPGAEPGPEEAGAAAPALSALAANSVPFENRDAKPLFSVILIDMGAAGLDRETLTTFSFPVTFAVDPTLPGAEEAAAAYRAAGFEVLILPSGLPEGARPQDLETTLQAYFTRFPQAAGLLETPAGGIQGDLALSKQLVEIAADSGHGLVFFDRGLNSVRREADRAGLPSAAVYRELDAARERAPVIERYLDRAAFRAAQEGAVVMVGHTYPDTVSALFSWALSAKGAEMALAPVSAVLRR